MRMTNDYTIIRAGSAGCLLAKQLSENQKKQILLIEAGQCDNYIWTPVEYLYCINNPCTDWL